MSELKIAVEASAAGGTTPIAANLRRAPPNRWTPPTCRPCGCARPWPSACGPPMAEVLVDGQPVGLARRFGGGFLQPKEWLELSPGKHRISSWRPAIAARTSWSRSLATAEKDRERIDVVLTQGGERMNWQRSHSSHRPGGAAAASKSLPGHIRLERLDNGLTVCLLDQPPGAGRDLGALLPRRHPRRAGGARRHRPLPRAHDVQGLGALRPGRDRPPHPGPRAASTTPSPATTARPTTSTSPPTAGPRRWPSRPTAWRASPSTPSRWRASGR